ncbi:MAG: ATP-binding protein [Pseudomonadota bacterium]
MLLGMLPALIIALFLGVYFSYSRIHDAEQALRERGIAQARYLAAAAEYGVVRHNHAFLKNLLNAQHAEAAVDFAAIYDEQFKLLTAVGELPPVLEGRAAQMEVGGQLIFTVPINLPPLYATDFFTLRDQATDKDGRRVGWVRVGMSLVHLAAINRSMLLTSAGICLLVMILGMALALRLSRNVTKPIREMLAVVHAIGAGSLHARVEHDAGGELGALQVGINQMTEDLSNSRRGLQLRIQEATAALAEQKDAAEHANIAKSKFLAAASHDLRQPIHALGLFLAALKETLHEPEQLRILANIEASVAAMEGLFNSLLDISRLDAGVLEVHERVFPVNRVLDRIRTEFTQQAETKGLKLLVVSSRALLLTDPMLLQRVLFNLVSNALRYTDSGGVVVGCRRRDSRVLIEVWDSGRGIPEDRQRDIFEEFVQLHNPERARGNGLGLGLAIVERVTRLLSCPLSLRSRPQLGSVFTVSVAQSLPGTEIEDLRDPGRRTLSGQMQGLAVVIDDDEEILAAMRSLLTGWGLRVISATTGSDALAQLDQVPDVLLCDYRLRDGEIGLDVIARFRASFGTQIPAVLITGDTAPESVRAIKVSGHALLYKPVRPAKLRVLLSKMLPHLNVPKKPYIRHS